MPVSKISRSLSNRCRREHNCEKSSDKVRMPQWVQVLKERSKTSISWRDERTHRWGQQVWRDDKHGKPMGTMSADDVVSTIKTSEVENTNSAFRKGQLKDIFSAGSDKFETKYKDHEFEDGAKALVLLSAGRHLVAQHSDAGSSIDWAEDLCQGRCADSSEDDVMIPKTTQRNHMIKIKKQETQCSSEGLAH